MRWRWRWREEKGGRKQDYLCADVDNNPPLDLAVLKSFPPFQLLPAYPLTLISLCTAPFIPYLLARLDREGGE